MAKKYICNKCGREFDEFDTQEAFRIYTHLGYGTKYDGDTLELDLCCYCMNDLIDSCKISPIIEAENKSPYIPCPNYYTKHLFNDEDN